MASLLAGDVHAAMDFTAVTTGSERGAAHSATVTAGIAFQENVVSIVESVGTRVPIVPPGAKCDMARSVGVAPSRAGVSEGSSRGCDYAMGAGDGAATDGDYWREFCSKFLMLTTVLALMPWLTCIHSRAWIQAQTLTMVIVTTSWPQDHSRETPTTTS